MARAAGITGARHTHTSLSRAPRNRCKEHLVRNLTLVLAGGIAALGAAHAMAQGSDPNLGRNLAATCANCHGTNGASVGEVESLAGKPKDEIVRKMQEFKSGARPATIMQQLAKGYTDEQIQSLAAWFAAQKPAN
jgi:sulfide dehydrogenase cytochrome subunit